MDESKQPPARHWYRSRREPTVASRSSFGRRALVGEQLESRLMMTHSPADHVHARLTILLDGHPVAIPADIGLAVPGHASGHYNPHTHDTSGTLHIGEGGPAGLDSAMRLVTIDDFFDVWRERGGLAGNNPSSRFNAMTIMDRTADATHVVRLFVNGQLNSQFEQYTPHDEDDILIRYDALPPAPGGLTLESLSDSGFSNGDRITNAASWQIQVNGVTPGALVELRGGGKTLGQATAVGTMVEITAASSSLSDGLVNVSAVQTLNGLTSPVSFALGITLDRVAPLVTLAPRAALAGENYSFDVISADEGQAGFAYSLISAPFGATISASTGVFSWLPTSADIGRHSMTVRAVDTAGNKRDVSANLYVVETAFPWTNPINALDIDGDGRIIPLDVLQMVNRINSGVDIQLPAPTTSSAAPPFYDVNRDGLLTALDVLQVINFINATTSGEGEIADELFAQPVSLGIGFVRPTLSEQAGSAVPLQWPAAAFSSLMFEDEWGQLLDQIAAVSVSRRR